MAELQDSELLIQIKQGSQPAFEEVFLKYYAELCTYANSILGSKDSSEEVTQEMFVKLWENRNSLEIKTSLKAYLYRTIHNQCINQIESWKVRNQYSKNQAQNIIPFSGDYPIANLIAQELELKIKESIDALPDQCREVFLLIRVHHKSYHEVAQKLNLSLNTVKTQMHRAITKLKGSLHEYLPITTIIVYYLFLS
jgi:RNA polymerase sigma-70 factor (ECF subfamily)